MGASAGRSPARLPPLVRGKESTALPPLSKTGRAGRGALDRQRLEQVAFAINCRQDAYATTAMASTSILSPSITSASTPIIVLAGKRAGST